MISLVTTFFLVFLALLAASHALLLGLALVEVLRRRATRMPELDETVMQDGSAPPITVLAPVYNAAAGVVEEVRNLLSLAYPNLQVLVINDGSRDRTMEILTEEFHLQHLDLVIRTEVPHGQIRATFTSTTDPRLMVIDKVRGGRADALNAGLAASRTPLVCVVDSDMVLDRRALLRMVEPFVYEAREVLAVTGTIRPINGSWVQDGTLRGQLVPDGLLPRFQIIDYLRGLLFTRLGMRFLGGNLSAAGTFGLHAREALVDVGGFSLDDWGTDSDLLVRIHRRARDAGRDYAVIHIPDPVCYTDAPETLADLAEQRERWQHTLGSALWRNRRMFLNPRYGRVGLLAFPFHMVFDVLGPLVEVLAFAWFAVALALGNVELRNAVLFVGLSFVFWFVLSLQSMILDDLTGQGVRGVGRRLAMLVTALLETLMFRPLVNLFRVRGSLATLSQRGRSSFRYRPGFNRRPEIL